MPQERRQKRSESFDHAIGHWLEAVGQRHSVPSMVLADESGFLVASSATDDLAEEAAAAAPTFSARSASGPLSDMLVDTLDVDGPPMYLCALGTGPGACASSISEARSGVERILAAC